MDYGDRPQDIDTSELLFLTFLQLQLGINLLKAYISLSLTFITTPIHDPTVRVVYIIHDLMVRVNIIGVYYEKFC